MKRKWAEREKILARRKFPPPECVGCFVTEPEKGECHIFRKGALCIVCATEVKADAHKSIFGVRDISATQFLELLKEAHAIHLQAEEIMQTAKQRRYDLAVEPFLPGLEALFSATNELNGTKWTAGKND